MIHRRAELIAEVDHRQHAFGGRAVVVESRNEISPRQRQRLVVEVEGEGGDVRLAEKRGADPTRPLFRGASTRTHARARTLFALNLRFDRGGKARVVFYGL